MNATPRLTGLALAGILLVAAACGSSSEDSLEQLIENETGEDVEIDLGDDGFSIESEDGTFTVDEDGNFTAVGEDGEVITGNIDADDDSINIQSDDGDLVIEGDGETGSIEITSDDGGVSFSSSEEIPDEWPAEVPQPTGLTVINGSVFDDGTNSGVTVTGTTSASSADFLASYGPMLEAAGFTQNLFVENEGNLTAGYESTAWEVSVSGFNDGSMTTVTVGVAPKTG